MRRIGWIGFALWVAVTATAALRTPADALRIADDFTESSLSSTSRMPRSPRTSSALSIADSTSTYFAVNTAPGFVLIGADDRLPEVIGYSDNGAFDPENISPAFRYWMSCYEEELSALTAKRSNSTAFQQRSGLTGAAGLSAISPLLKSTWSQGEPYNNQAPLYNDNNGRCVTGCVATAMAQVMYYYKHPVKGKGSHSYYWVCTEPVGKSGTLSANFETTYQWDKMLNSYKSGYTSEQADAVATLMYHCGVSVNMGYGSSSGAYTSDVPKALNTYFNYDANYQRIQKVMYAPDSLNAIIYAELKAQRPVIVSGSNDEGGHAFVCDGCDNKGYFHINWGWNGSNDGYFLLTALNPKGPQGIGGTTQGYNKGTAFFIGLQPTKTGTPKAIPQMAAQSLSVSSQSFSRSSSFSASVERLENFGLTDFNGSYGVALYDEDETQLVAILKQQDNYSLKAGKYRTTAATLSSLKIPSTLPAGTYHLCFVYKDTNYDWMRLLCTQDDYYRTLEVTATKVTFYANDAAPELTLTQPIAFPEGMNTDSIPKTGCPLSFSFKNTGGTFRGDISARIYKGSFSKGQYEIMDSVVVRRSKTLSSALQEKFDKDLLLNTQYKMKLCWRAGESDEWHEFTPTEYASVPFKLYDPEYHLSLTDTIRFDNNDSVPRSHANLYYNIKNTGAVFHGELQVSFYQTYFSRGKSSIREVTIGTNQTLSDAFSGPLEQVAGTYDVILRYREPDGEWQDFTDLIGDNLGAISATIYDDTPTGIEQIDASAIHGGSAKYILDGRLVIEHAGHLYNAQGILLK